MSEKDHEFWTSNHKYEDLARTYEQNIALRHPGYVTSERMCPCIEYCGWCSWAATTVDYYEYQGPRPQS